MLQFTVFLSVCLRVPLKSVSKVFLFSWEPAWNGNIAKWTNAADVYLLRMNVAQIISVSLMLTREGEKNLMIK